MKVELADRVRLEVAPEGTRVVARVFVGNREIPPTPEVLEAVAALCSGKRQLPMELLLEHGVFIEHQPGVIPDGLLALAPRAALGVRLRAGTATVTRRGRVETLPVLPENSLPIGGFVPPEVLGPIQHLAGLVRDAWYHLLRAAHSRGRLVEPDSALALLRGLVDERLAEDTGLAAILGWESGRLVARRALQQEAFAYPVSEVDFIDDRDPALATDRLRYGVRPDEVFALGALLGAYGGGSDALTLRATIESAPRLIGLAGGLVGTPMLRSKAAPIEVERGCVAHLGHATLLANLGGAHVLIDPWFPPGSRADETAPLGIDQLPPLAGIFFTHHHWDHVNLSTLLRLDKSTRVYVPAQPDRPLVPKTASWLRSLGFVSVTEVAQGQYVDVGSGGRVVAAPFTGEDPTDVGWAGATWVLVHDGAAAWVHVDSGPDRHGASTVTSGAAAALREHFGPLDPVFATRRQERGTMVEHSWEFLFAEPDAWVRPTENCCNDAAFLGALQGAAGGSVVLYSEGGADWYPSSTDFLRPHDPGANDRIQMYLWDDEAAFRDACPGLEVSQPGHVWRIGGGRAGALTW